MNKFTNKIAKLIEVKKIISIMVSIVFCVMSLKGDIPVEQFMTIATVVFTFYFTQSALRRGEQDTNTL